jgi:hypothetical protein
VPVIQPLSQTGETWISAMDAVGLLVLLFTLAGGMGVLILSLWLLFRTTQTLPELGPK